MPNKKNKDAAKGKKPATGQPKSTVRNRSITIRLTRPAAYRRNLGGYDPSFQEDVYSCPMWNLPPGGGSGYHGGSYFNNYYGPPPPNRNQPPLPPPGFGFTVNSSQGVHYLPQDYQSFPSVTIISRPSAPEQMPQLPNPVARYPNNYQDDLPQIPNQNESGFMEPGYWTPPEWNPDHWCSEDTSYVEEMNPPPPIQPQQQIHQRRPPPPSKNFIKDQKLLQIFREQTAIPPELSKKIRFPSSILPPPYSSTKPGTSSKSPDILAANLFQSLLVTASLPPADLQKLASFPLQRQLKGLVSTQTLSLEQLRLGWQVCFDLLTILRPHYPDLKVEPYGSLLTGLTLNPPNSSETSEKITIHLQLSKSSQPVQDKDQRLREAALGCKSILGGKQCPHTGSRLLLKYLKKGCGGTPPSLEFVHIPSKFLCKLTFEEDNVNVQRSRLIQRCFSSDSRIQPFFTLLQYWARYHRILEETEEDQGKMSGYALFLLMVTFLTEYGVLQVNVIQQEGNWGRKTTSFNQNMVLEVMSWMEEFWEKYENLKFYSVVVCPLVGKLMPVTAFLPENREFLPDKLKEVDNLWQELGLQPAAMVIQDPIMPCENVWGQRGHKVVEQFQMACRIGKKTLEGNTGTFGGITGGVLALFVEGLGKGKEELNEITVVCEKKIVWQATYEMDEGFVEGFLGRLKGKKILEGMKQGKLEGMIKGEMEEAWKIGAKDFVEKVMGIGLNLPGQEGIYWVTYPFWRKRVKEDYVEGEDPLVLEGDLSKVVLDLWEEGTLEKDDNVGEMELELEKVEDKEGPPKKRVKRMLEIFKEFAVEVLSELKVKDGLPCLKVSISKRTMPNSVNVDTQTFENAVAALSKLFDRAFPAYQLYHLGRTLPI